MRKAILVEKHCEMICKLNHIISSGHLGQVIVRLHLLTVVFQLPRIIGGPKQCVTCETLLPCENGFLSISCCDSTLAER